MKLYKFSVDIDYSPTGASYRAGETDALKDWKPEHIRSALAAGLIQEKTVKRKKGETNGGYRTTTRPEITDLPEPS